MSRILAIDWDRREARALVLHKGPTGLSVERAVAVELPASAEGGLPGDRVEKRLSAALSAAKLSGASTVVAVGRDDVQFKQLSVPPAPLDELPDMVRFQAGREFNALGEDMPLDYLVIAGDDQTPYELLAAAINSDGLQKVESICQELDAKQSRITMRACASASLARRAADAAGKHIVLFVHPLAAEADFALLVDGRIELLRSIRIPTAEQSRFETSDHRIVVQSGDIDSESAQPESPRRQVLVGEIRRTMASAGNQLGGRAIEAILIAGSTTDDRDLAELVGRQVGVDTKHCDPWQFVPGGLPSGQVAADTAARWAATIGMALDEAGGIAPAIDFLHVHRKQERRRFERAHALGVAAAVVMLLAAIVYGWNRYARPWHEADQIAAELRMLEPQIQQYAEIQADAAAVEEWLATDVTWLDELQSMSKQLRPEPLESKTFPEADDVLVTQLTLLPPRGAEGAGRVDLHAASRSASTVAPVERRLRDDRHRVIDRGGAQRDATPPYGWEFQSEIEVDRSAGSEEAAL